MAVIAIVSADYSYRHHISDICDKETVYMRKKDPDTTFVSIVTSYAGLLYWDQRRRVKSHLHLWLQLQLAAMAPPLCDGINCDLRDDNIATIYQISFMMTPFQPNKFAKNRISFAIDAIATR
jgi:hypothetical protein